MPSAIPGLWLYHGLCVEPDLNFGGLRGVQHELVAPSIPPDARPPLCSPNVSTFTLKCRSHLAQLRLKESSCPGAAGMGQGWAGGHPKEGQ